MLSWRPSWPGVIRIRDGAKLPAPTVAHDVYKIGSCVNRRRQMLGKHLGRSERLARKFQARNVYAIAVRSPHKKEATKKPY
jgi:hypothetical protein